MQLGATLELPAIGEVAADIFGARSVAFHL
jgi:hypothetical protein